MIGFRLRASPARRRWKRNTTIAVVERGVGGHELVAR